MNLQDKAVRALIGIAAVMSVINVAFGDALWAMTWMTAALSLSAHVRIDRIEDQ